MKPSIRLWATAVAAALILTVPAFSIGCGSTSSSPATPTPTPTPTPAPGLAAPALVSPVGTQQLDTINPTLVVKNAVATGTVGTVTYRFEWSDSATFPVGSHTGFRDGVPQASGDSTSFLIPDSLTPNFTYFWRARATNGTITSDWSKTESFNTQNKGFYNGQNVYDPLDNSTTVGHQIGGHFVGGNNGGWQADGLYDGIDYDIPTCGSCKVEFDVTNFGKGEGTAISIDVKWFSMGDSTTFNSFAAFRDSPWKMHIEQRSDGDGSGMQLIWRNGATDADTGGDPEYGDHRGKFLTNGPDFHSNLVFHYVIQWTPTTYAVSINGQQWFPGVAADSGRFGGGHAYTPPNHRIELGCIPRGESMPGARYRNVRISPQ